jgi:predicted small secreted protein
MRKLLQVAFAVLLSAILLTGCVIPRTAGKAAVGVTKGAAKGVKAVGKGVKNAVD